MPDIYLDRDRLLLLAGAGEAERDGERRCAGDLDLLRGGGDADLERDLLRGDRDLRRGDRSRRYPPPPPRGWCCVVGRPYRASATRISRPSMTFPSIPSMASSASLRS